MKKNTLIVIAAFVLTATGYLIAKPEYGWLLVNGYSANNYAVELLAGNSQKTPDWAIDLVVIKENDLVLFSEHNSNKIYAFSPSKAPVKETIVWSHMWGSWYVGTIKT